MARPDADGPRENRGTPDAVRLICVTWEQTWRVSTLGRIAGGALTGAFALGSIAAIVGGIIDGRAGTFLTYLVLAVISAGMSAGSYVGSIRPSISINDEFLRVRNPLRGDVVPLREIERVVPSYSGLMVYSGPRSAVCAWAVQKSNLATWRHQQVRADRIADEITERVAAARGRTST